MTIDVEGRIFSFPNGWLVEKYDDGTFYRNRFEKCLKGVDGVKAIDILAFSPDKTMWLIEAKDYRLHRRRKETTPAEEFALKVRDSLAGISAYSILTRGDRSGQLVSKIISEAVRIRLVYQFEQPAKHSKLFPRAFDIADIEQKIKCLLKSIDPRPMVIDRSNQTKVLWTVA